MSLTLTRSALVDQPQSDIRNVDRHREVVSRGEG